ncbi:MAG: hypothetical protein D6761_06180 [Candidatus Dadabacteria bacterium]|nr:MAG: hypothetical protein D6761_06180 [Candidatus Dadabacteria bacterium]
MSEQETNETPTLEEKVIKRYPNRKLYDTSESRYVNLDELAQMIREGYDVKVVDHKTGEDMTGMVLAQIIYEEEKKRQRTMPAEVMKRIIQFGEQSVGQWFGRILAGNEHPMQTIRQDVEAQVRGLVERGQLTREEANRFLKEWVDDTTHSLEEWQQKVDQRVVEIFDRVTGIPTLRDHLEELLDRIDLMEKRLDVIEDRFRRAVQKLG